MAWCASLGFIGNPEYSWVSWAMNWGNSVRFSHLWTENNCNELFLGLAYDLPNGTWVNEHRDKKMWPKPLVQRRHRRELYRRLEVAIDRYAWLNMTLQRVQPKMLVFRMGYDGRSCVLRALCESAQYFYQKSTHMVEELIRTVFSYVNYYLIKLFHELMPIFIYWCFLVCLRWRFYPLRKTI